MAGESSSRDYSDCAFCRHWHLGANYPNERTLGQIGCFSTFGEAVTTLAHDLELSDLSPEAIAGVHHIPTYLDEIRTSEARVRAAYGMAFLADGLIFWVQPLPSDRDVCDVAQLQSPLL